MIKSPLEKELDDLALACKGVTDKREFLKPFFPKLFVAIDSPLGSAILNEILTRAKNHEILAAPVVRKSRVSIEAQACRKSIRGDRLTKPDDGYWG
jgi:hypothetical protein